MHTCGGSLNRASERSTPHVKGITQLRFELDSTTSTSGGARGAGGAVPPGAHANKYGAPSTCGGAGGREERRKDVEEGRNGYRLLQK
jgi:hypothetical protein